MADSWDAVWVQQNVHEMCTNINIEFVTCYNVLARMYIASVSYDLNTTLSRWSGLCCRSESYCRGECKLHNGETPLSGYVLVEIKGLSG